MNEIKNNDIHKEKSEEHELWVEKYSPKSYIDLLSDDVKSFESFFYN
jgi:hypothetical protein